MKNYTITVNGSNSKVNGEFIADSKKSIFTIGSDKIPRLTIDVSNSDISDNTGFTFTDGNTYIISTQYYYYKVDSQGNFVIGPDGQPVKERLEDLDGKFTYTTMLNLWYGG